MNNKQDWENILGQLTESERKAATTRINFAGIFSTIVSLTSICVFGGVMLMLANMLAISAWPDLDFLEPGIGFRKGAGLIAIGGVLLLVKTSFVEAIRNSINGGNK